MGDGRTAGHALPLLQVGPLSLGSEAQRLWGSRVGVEAPKAECLTGIEGNLGQSCRGTGAVISLGSESCARGE